MSKAGPTEAKRGEAGYTFAAMLVLLVALALGAQATVIPTSTERQRAAEEELIHRGLAYARAIESYWRADPENPAFPPTLEALLDDPREDGRRHIRRLLDPVIAEDWTLIPAEGGGISGVAPDSNDAPFKRSGFPEGVDFPEDVTAYADWQFVFDPEKEDSSL